jgi:hypothetical protein
MQMTENLSSVLVPYGDHYRHLTGPAGVGLGSLMNQLSHFLFIFTTFAYETSPLYSVEIWGMPIFK